MVDRAYPSEDVVHPTQDFLGNSAHGCRGAKDPGLLEAISRSWRMQHSHDVGR